MARSEQTKTVGSKAALITAIIALIVGLGAAVAPLVSEDEDKEAPRDNRLWEITLTQVLRDVITPVVEEGDHNESEEGNEHRKGGQEHGEEGNETHNETEEHEHGIIGQYHAWEPGVIVINEGDYVRLTIKNPLPNDHSFTLEFEPGDFSGTTATDDILGTLNSGTQDGTETSITFQAHKAGTYLMGCNTEHDHEENKCAPDHDSNIGYIVVLG